MAMTRTNLCARTNPALPHRAAAGAALAAIAAFTLFTSVNVMPESAWAQDEAAGWSPEVACAACHASQDASASAGPHGVLGCVACHTDEGLIDVHEEASEPPTSTLRRLKATEVDDDTCLACHGDGMPFAPASDADDEDDEQDVATAEAGAASEAAKTGLAERNEEKDASQEQAETAIGAETDDETIAIAHTALAAATATCDVLTDTKGTTVNPHDLPEVDEHQSIGCVSCHKGHSESDPAETAPSQCSSCHHAGAYECNTCHASDDVA